MAGRLQGKTVLVTGASKGLGRILALACADEGADLAICARSASQLRETASMVHERGQRCLIFELDVTDEVGVRAMTAEILDTYGRIDVLFNNAGVIGADTAGGLLPDIPLSAWESVMNINLTGYFLVLKAVLPSMMERRQGNVIQITSGLGFRKSFSTEHWIPSVPYNVSKAGVELLTQCAAIQMHPYGICVNSLSPGPLETEIHALSPAHIRSTLRSAQSIAEPAIFLAQQTVDTLTGATVLALEWLDSNGQKGILFEA
jgi:NAD(P)-dependent dehydrogenase (short-subunit alcohol dehydrogenase family)